MGCACTRPKIAINPLGNNSSYSNKERLSSKNQYIDSTINAATYSHTLLSLKKGIKKPTLNEYDIIENKLSYIEEDNKNNNEHKSDSSSSYNIIELIPMERRSLFTKIEKIRNEKLGKTCFPNKSKLSNNFPCKSITVTPKYINSHSSSVLKQKNLFEGDSNIITNKKQMAKNNFDLYSNVNEQMINIWFDKGDEIKFIISNDNWGIKEKGLCNYKGYEEKFNGFNLCCLLMRIGNENSYIPINNNVIYSKNDGPLFLKMNVTQNYLNENNYNLEGYINFDIINGEKLSTYQIFNRFGFEGEFFDYQKNEIIFTLNIFRKNPKKFYSIFLPCDNLNLKYSEEGINCIYYSEKLQKISDYIVKNENTDIDNSINFVDLNINNLDSNFIDYIDNSKINNCIIKKTLFIMDYNVPLDLIRKIIKENQEKYITDINLIYISISIHNIDNIKNLFRCCILLSNNFL